MANYKKMYMEMFIAAEAAIDLLTKSSHADATVNSCTAAIRLIESQRKCEDMYIESKETNLRLIG